MSKPKTSLIPWDAQILRWLAESSSHLMVFTQEVRAARRLAKKGFAIEFKPRQFKITAKGKASVNGNPQSSSN